MILLVFASGVLSKDLYSSFLKEENMNQKGSERFFNTRDVVSTRVDSIENVIGNVLTIRSRYDNHSFANSEFHGFVLSKAQEFLKRNRTELSEIGITYKEDVSSITEEDVDDIMRDCFQRNVMLSSFNNPVTTESDFFGLMTGVLDEKRTYSDFIFRIQPKLEFWPELKEETELPTIDIRSDAGFGRGIYCFYVRFAPNSQSPSAKKWQEYVKKTLPLHNLKGLTYVHSY